MVKGSLLLQLSSERVSCNQGGWCGRREWGAAASGYELRWIVGTSGVAHGSDESYGKLGVVDLYVLAPAMAREGRLLVASTTTVGCDCIQCIGYTRSGVNSMTIGQDC
jgi:hypothetical protein